jgi:hypothetical protein
MLSGKLISSKDLIWKIYKDAGFQEELNWSDIIEYFIDTLEFIYHPDNFEKRVMGYKNNPDFDVQNYRVKIPCNLVHLVSLTVDGFPALPSTNTFHQLMDGSCCGVDEFASILSNGTFVDGFGNTFVTNLGTTYSGVPLTYELNNDWITLSVKTGKVCIAYLAHPVDDCGFPMIPDDVFYREALSRGVIARLDYQKWRQNPSDNGLRALYEHSEQQANWYIGGAQNRAKLPDTNKMEVMKNMLLRLKPEINQWAYNFAHLPTGENKRLH